MSEKNEKFSETVASELGHYVYRLIDPRNGETFYVGQGTNNRVFDHVNGKPKLGEHETKASTKQARISSIGKQNLKVLHVIHRHKIPEEAVNHVEAALIDAYPGLSNIQSGIGSNATGPMNSEQIKGLYGLPTFIPNPKHKLLLINVNRSFDDENNSLDLYDSTRFAWRVSKPKADKVDYVISVVRGVTKAVFVADEWLPATQDHFPNFTPVDREGRFAFHGGNAPQDIYDEYVGKHGMRLDEDQIKFSQNPIRYWP